MAMLRKLLSFAILIFPLILLGEEPYPRVYRNFMPDSGPSAFGVELAPKIALCYDPLRGGINFIWQGSLDLSPTRQAKINQPAKIIGDIFYYEQTFQPLRIETSDKEPVRRFKGYELKENSVTFHFTLNDHLVSETLSPTEDGSGVIRRFSRPEGQTLFFILEPQEKSHTSVQGALLIKSGVWKHDASQNDDFSMTIQPK